MLPARLPVVLLNGASGIAVGMATEIPSHNLTEVAKAAIALIRDPELTLAGVMKYIKGPDFPGRRPDHHAARRDARGLRRRPRLGARARALDDRAPRARPVAAGGARAAAGRLRAQGAGGNRRDHQPAAEGRARSRSRPSRRARSS